MIIQTVTYRKLRSFGHYENETVGATASVGDAEKPEEALAELSLWVNERLGTAAQVSASRNDLANVKYEIGQRTVELEQLQKRIQAMVDFLKAHGVPTDTWALPF